MHTGVAAVKNTTMTIRHGFGRAFVFPRKGTLQKWPYMVLRDRETFGGVEGQYGADNAANFDKIGQRGIAMCGNGLYGTSEGVCMRKAWRTGSGLQGVRKERYA